MKTKHLSEADFRELRDYVSAHSAYVPESVPAQIIFNAGCLLTETLLRTGCRPEELVDIEFSFFDFDRKQIFIRAAKGSRDRSVPVSEEYIERVKTWVPHIPRSGFMANLITPSVVPRNKKQVFERAYKRVLKHIWPKKYYPPSYLRHTFAIRMLRRCPDIQKVQLAMGHKSIQSTMHYLKYLAYEDLHDDILKAVG